MTSIMAFITCQLKLRVNEQKVRWRDRGNGFWPRDLLFSFFT
jgi:hypothetical protein